MKGGVFMFDVGLEICEFVFVGFDFGFGGAFYSREFVGGVRRRRRRCGCYVCVLKCYFVNLCE